MKINDSVDYFGRYKPSAEKIYYNFDFNTVEYYVPGYPVILCFSLLFSDIWCSFGLDQPFIPIAFLHSSFNTYFQDW